jgi:hypothetical protein
MRVAVRVCATVSAIPPRTFVCVLAICCRALAVLEVVYSYGVRDHGGEEWAGGIVGVKLAHKEGDHGDLDEEDDGVE